jgi:hypothetical protein
LNRKSSMAASSAADSIIWIRSARNRSAIATAYLGPHLAEHFENVKFDVLAKVAKVDKVTNSILHLTA